VSPEEEKTCPSAAVKPDKLDGILGIELGISRTDGVAGVVVPVGEISLSG
jgi:hypothetical protein